MKVLNIILALLILSSGTIQTQILDSCVKQCCCSSNQQQEDQTCCEKESRSCPCLHPVKTGQPAGVPVYLNKNHASDSHKIWAGVLFVIPTSAAFIKPRPSKPSLYTQLLFDSISRPLLN